MQVVQDSKSSVGILQKHLDWLWSSTSISFSQYLGVFPGAKVARVWSWPLSIWCKGQEWVELYLCSPHMPSWQVWVQLHLYKFTYVPVYIFCCQISLYKIADIMYCCFLLLLLLLLLLPPSPIIIIIRRNARLVTVVCRNILIVSAFVCEGGLIFSCTSDEAVIFQNTITRSKGIFASGTF